MSQADSSRCYVLLVLFTMATGEKPIPSVADYFQLKDDMTNLTWAHAVNSQFLLKKALGDTTVMMLEADVVLGKLRGGNDTLMPIMAHPPLKESDLSLREFLNAVIEVQTIEKKGVKLDFKSTDAFLWSLDVMDAVRDKFVFPVWLNADILKGPVDSETRPVDATSFLVNSSQKFSTATLSLGWTTRYGPNVTGSYTDEQLTTMRTAIVINNIHQPVTLAVRAGIAAQTTDGILSLVEDIDEFQSSKKTTVTVWMSTDTDAIDIAKLKNLILQLGKSRVFLDVPDAIRNQLNLDSSSGKTPVTKAIGAFVAVVTSVSALFTNAFNLFD